MSNLNVKTILKLLEVIKKAGDDRILMMWMADAQAEEQVKALGLSGSLNYDKNAPELGIFFNVKLANKLGIYVDIKTTMGISDNDIDALEKQIHELMEDDEIMKKSGIYSYVLSGDLCDLSFRTFDK